MDMPYNKLRSEKKLEPVIQHPGHSLTDRMLLHSTPNLITTNDNGEVVMCMCASCAACLRKKKMLALSLVNGLWIGDVPLVLQTLTLPERILVACHFPAAYIVKLYPKKKGACVWAEGASLHSGLQGNMSTYWLNTTDVANMTCDSTMPPPSQILAATVGITFVGPQNLPERMLPGFL